MVGMFQRKEKNAVERRFKEFHMYNTTELESDLIHQKSHTNVP